jgi:hypothetical protein
MMSRDYKYYDNQVPITLKDNSKFVNSFSLKIKFLVFLRLFFMTFIIWGPVVIGNVLYLAFLLSSKSTHTEEIIFTIGFAMFKLIWSNTIPNMLWENEWLFFNIHQDIHEEYLSRFGYFFTSKTNFIFALNSVAVFFVPIFVQMCTDPSCFYNIFIKEPASFVSYQYNSCNIYKSNGECAGLDLSFGYKFTTIFTNIYTKEFVTKSTIEAAVPFVYNYTCSNSILKVYSPLYIIMYTLLLCHSFVSFLFICWDLKKMHINAELIENGNNGNNGSDTTEDVLETGCIVLGRSGVKRRWVRGTIVKCNPERDSFDVNFGFRKLTSIQKDMIRNDLRIIKDSKDTFSFVTLIKTFMPLKHLLYKCSERLQVYDYSRGVFRSRSSSWVPNGTPNRLSSVLIMMTFGFFVPLLGFVIAVFMITNIGLSRLVLGKFLVRELTVIELYRQKKATESNMKLPFKFIITEGKKLDLLKNDIRDVNEPWGSKAAIVELEKQCSVLQSSMFMSSRYVYTIIFSAMFSFAVNDVYNGEIGNQEFSITVPSIGFILPGLFIAVLIIFERYSNDNDNDNVNDNGNDNNRVSDNSFASKRDDIAFQRETGDIEFANVVNPMNTGSLDI